MTEKYGKDRVAQIITFGTMAARAAVRDVGRSLNFSYAEVDRIAKMIPFELGMTIERALEINPELRTLYNEDYRVKRLIDTSKKLEGMPRHASTHAAGVVISKEPITQYVPLQKNDDIITTQFPMGTIEQLGLLKMDFLGLRTLTVIRDALDLIKTNTGKTINIEEIPLDDPGVYDMLSQADTDGVFQLESSGMRQFLKELKPNTFEDIIAGISLYRPGPMDQIPQYIKNKNNPQSIEYIHDSLEPVLSVTYGCIIYQEQVMQIVRDLAGYSLGRSDLLRRAMSKKKSDIMEEERRNFIYGLKDEDSGIEVPGALSSGIPLDKANQIFDVMAEFAKYAFNKSHAAAYALVAYWTAWLKYHYPVEYLAALMTSVMSNTGKVAAYIQYCRKRGIDVLPPDVNQSRANFTVVGNKIRFGLAAVKNVGIPAINAIIEAREKKGEFKSFTDFCRKVDSAGINKKMVESLIKCGAFDSLNVYRSQLIAVYEKVLDGISQERRKNIQGQVSLFDGLYGDQENSLSQDVLPDIDEFPLNIKLAMEKEVTGIYISGHPLSEYKSIIDSMNTTLDLLTLNSSENGVEDVVLGNELMDGSPVKIGGIIVDKKIKSTRNNQIMAFVMLEDLYGSVEVIVFPSVYEKYRPLLEEDSLVILEGRLSLREEEDPKILVDKVRPLVKMTAREKKLFIKIQKNANIDINKQICPILRRYSGNIPVYLYMEETGKKFVANRELWVQSNEELLDILAEVLGEHCVKLIG